uniref:Uncharacterized protein n=1 Tax=Lepeophtheirus salmonis TaxID=72036 RepID=A0A0K2UNZ1_LEPSM
MTDTRKPAFTYIRSQYSITYDKYSY